MLLFSKVIITAAFIGFLLEPYTIGIIVFPYDFLPYPLMSKSSTKMFHRAKIGYLLN